MEHMGPVVHRPSVVVFSILLFIQSYFLSKNKDFFSLEILDFFSAIMVDFFLSFYKWLSERQ